MPRKRRYKNQQGKSKKYRLFNSKHDRNKLPIFDPHRPITLPNLIIV